MTPTTHPSIRASLLVLAGLAVSCTAVPDIATAAERGGRESAPRQLSSGKGNASRHGQGRGYAQRYDRGHDRGYRNDGHARLSGGGDRDRGHARGGHHGGHEHSDGPRVVVNRYDDRRDHYDANRYRYDGRRYDYDRDSHRYRYDGHRRYVSGHGYVSGYRPPVYYTRGHGHRYRYYPPVHVVRPPLHHYTTVHVSGYPFPYYYAAGYYYRPYGDNFWISVSAPIGARVHSLPAGYVTFGYGGRTYYHAHSTYYLYDRPAQQYVVVEPPAESPVYPGTLDTVDEIFVYPARGQSEELTQRDRYECHLWAVDEVGADPSLGEADDQLRADYRRALTACLEGRGYTVR